MIARERNEDRWAATLGDGTAFPPWRVIAYQSMFGYRPPNTSHAYNAQPCTKFRLLAAARVAATAIA